MYFVCFHNVTQPNTMGSLFCKDETKLKFSFLLFQCHFNGFGSKFKNNNQKIKEKTKKKRKKNNINNKTRRTVSFDDIVVCRKVHRKFVQCVNRNQIRRLNVSFCQSMLKTVAHYNCMQFQLAYVTDTN